MKVLIQKGIMKMCRPFGLEKTKPNKANFKGLDALPMEKTIAEPSTAAYSNAI